MPGEDVTVAVAEAYRAHYRRLVAVVYAATGDYAEAQDAVQEAYARALDRPRQFLEVLDPQAWLRTVALNVARHRWRRRQVLQRLLPTRELDRLCADVMELTRQPELSVIQRRVARHRLRRRAVTGTALALALLAGGVTATHLPHGRHTGQVDASPSPSPSVWVSPPAPGDLPPEPKGPIRTAHTADGTHLYALLFDCPGCQPYRLVGSDDGGRTWTTRDNDATGDLIDFQLHASGILSTDRTPLPRISTDGGRTWRPTTLDSTPVRSVPPGGWLSCYRTGAQTPGPDLLPPACTVGAVDPTTRTVHPLASAPSIPYFEQATVPTAAGLWLIGHDAQFTPSVAVSRDGGATWSVHAFTTVKSSPLQLATYDGRTAYLVTSDRDGFRTSDGGRTWQPLNGGEKLTDSLTESPSIVRPDGTHVMQHHVGNGFVLPMVGRDGGARYVAEPSPNGYGPPLSMTFGGGYTGRTWAAIYLSTDGRTWTTVTPH